MSFGFSIGDFLATLQLAYNIRENFARAPKQFNSISDEVRSLSIVLQDITDNISGYKLNKQQRCHLGKVSHSCREVLQELKKTIDPYEVLGSRGGNFGQRTKRYWKQLKWEPEKIRELRDRIASNVALLHIFFGGISNPAIFEIKEGVHQLNQRHHDQERQLLLDWITPTNHGLYQSDQFRRRQAGTGHWLLNSSEYHSWLKATGRTLFCPGIPGAGKTIFTSIVIDDLISRSHDETTTGIAYVYCNFRQVSEQRLDDLLASLLKQLLADQPSLPDNIKSLYSRHRGKQTRPSLEEILRALQDVASLYSRLFIVVDALDECQSVDGCRYKFISELFHFQDTCGANLFVTSRFIPEVTEKFDGRSTLLEIRASPEDVRKYLDGHILSGILSRNHGLQEDVKAGIVKSVQGMFLLAKLQLRSLANKSSAKMVREALAKLPRGAEAYDLMYEDAMKRIECQVPEQEELAMQVLLWITSAKTPLTTTELQHALGVELGHSSFDEENLPQIEDMVSVCAGLVTVDEDSDIIRLVHYTAQQYFERTQSRWFSNADSEIMKICICYLSFDIFNSGFCEADDQFESRLSSHQLYKYAARNWGHHASIARVSCEELISFLSCEAKVEAASQALMTATRHNTCSNYSQVGRQMRGLHLAAYFGVKDAIEALLQRGIDVGWKDDDGRTPLLHAAWKGHGAIVRLLLATDGVDANSKDNNGRTSLSYAAWYGNEAVVKLLVARDDVDVDSKDDNGRTPLSRAAENGHAAVVDVLLKTDRVNPNSKDSDGWTPLCCAAEKGHEAVVRLLLGLGRVDAGFKDHLGLISLSWAVWNGHEAIVKLLLEKDSKNADFTDRLGRTLLSWAAEDGNEAIVKLLLATDSVDANSKDKSGRTPVSYATENGHEGVIKVLQSSLVIQSQATP